ncbi:amidohydrolase family protein [Pseudomonas sp. 21LCFQ010]|uniref:amidohydrolase family protein n=1 Tax=Pseudomonas sp. 21LCFQ010 TaxID=2957506 RepID=UPI002097970E|nr:amidohydrolase family protein [Pseudomonas sp. 21LCFQ010]MCO8161084.1 amidohydrolase family protein [Pseudomonas sp. 21LCFQ010]
MFESSNRRQFIKNVGVLGGLAFAASHGVTSYADEAFPYSAGTQPPRLRVPALACDCHHHIYDRAFPYYDDRNLPTASVEDYQRLQKRLGLTRSVVIQPSSYATDNRCLLAALKKLGPQSRGVAVVDDTVEVSELRRLHEHGVRAIRFNLGTGSATTVAMIEPLSKLIADLGWHIEIHTRPDELIQLDKLLTQLPVQIAFDHFGRIPLPVGNEHPVFKMIARLVDKDRAWVKVSGAYQDSVLGGPDYDDVKDLARGMIALAPERVVWGTDWPHPSLQTKKKPMPDDASMFDLLKVWAQKDEMVERILVTNPAKLYGF